MYRNEIDGIRAIAVVSVILNHFDQSILPNGHLGVDIFFVISGFVITQSLINRKSETFRKFVSGFYTRRIKRLFPALFTCVLVTTALVLITISPRSYLSNFTLLTGVSSLFGLSNLYLLFQSTDYFSESASLNAFTHTWSLGVEEQFYLLFPFIFWFTGLSEKSRTGTRYFFISVAVLGAFSLILFITKFDTNNIGVFYMMPTRFWELGLGALVCVSMNSIDKIKSSFRIVFSYISLIALVGLFFSLLSQNLHENQKVSILLVVFFTALLILSIPINSIAQKVLSGQILGYLGKRSYSLYLWHWSVLVMSRLTIGVSITTIPFLVALIFILSVFSYRYIENPLRRSEWEFRCFGKFKITDVFRVFITCSFGFLILNLYVLGPLHDKKVFYQGTEVTMIKQGTSSLSDPHVFENYIWRPEKCVLSDNEDVGKIIDAEDCTIGDFHSSKPRFLIVGNSFSAAQSAMYDVLVSRGLGAVTITSAWGASIVPELENTSAWGEANRYYWDSVIPKLLSQLKKGDTLFLVNDGASFSPKRQSASSRQNLKILEQGLLSISKRMKERNINVLYQSSLPFMRESNCIPQNAAPQWWQVVGGTPCTYYSREETLKRRKNYHKILLRLETSQNNFYVLDLFDVFCPDKICRFYRDNLIMMYRDGRSHPSVEASRLAQKLFAEKIESILKNQ